MKSSPRRKRPEQYLPPRFPIPLPTSPLKGEEKMGPTWVHGLTLYFGMPARNFLGDTRNKEWREVLDRALAGPQCKCAHQMADLFALFECSWRRNEAAAPPENLPRDARESSTNQAGSTGASRYLMFSSAHQTLAVRCFPPVPLDTRLNQHEPIRPGPWRVAPRVPVVPPLRHCRNG